MNTYFFNRVYVKAAATACGPIEAAGPLVGCFDTTFEDVYCDERNYEAAERRLLKEAVDKTMIKATLTNEQIDIAIGGDLMNQLATSHYFMKDYAIPFMGVYGACSTSVLASLSACNYIEHHIADAILAFCSSHNQTAERQFRYPNEYAVQKPPSTTFTATGAGAILFSSELSDIKVTSATLGKIIDFDFTNVNDMGSAMAPAAFDTIKEHFKNTNTSFEDYDLIATGDLSQIGNEVLSAMFKFENKDTLDKLVDCGLILYDRSRQEVFSGGSGAACSILVSIAYFFEQLRLGNMKKIMIVATGALHTPILVQQKQSIPCIAHAIVYERVE